MRNFRILSSEYGVFRGEIQEIFKHKLRQPAVLYDPMAGTAPLIPFIETNGHVAYLNDALPIHFFINQAKTYSVFQAYKQHGYDWYFRQLLCCMDPLKDKRFRISDKWIDDEILEGLIQAWHATEQYDRSSATLMKAAILLCVRPFSSTTRSNNATWLKYGGISSAKELNEIVGDGLTRFDAYYRHHYYGPLSVNKSGKCIITKQNAARLRLPQKVDFILTSPPYCNRLDPIVQYGPENYFLSALGHTSPEADLVSTTKVKDYGGLTRDFEYLTSHSEYVCKLLTRIKESPIADERSYYLKYYTRYFARLSHVLDKVLTNLSKTGKMYIVTQDNKHRAERIEIDRVIKELLGAKGWQSRIIKKWERHHQGLRNISRRHAFTPPRQLEKLMVVWA